MRRRRPLAVLCVGSLLLFAGVVILWVRSYLVGDWFWERTAGPGEADRAERSFVSGGGGLTFSSTEYVVKDPKLLRTWATISPLGRGYTRLPTEEVRRGATMPGVLGFDWNSNAGGNARLAGRTAFVRVPYWAVAALPALLPAVVGIRRLLAYWRSRPFVPRIEKGQRPSRVADAVMLCFVGLIGWAVGTAGVAVLFWALFSRRPRDEVLLYVPVGVAIALAALVGWYVNRPYAPLRRAFGLCGHCGYDLTHNTTGVCPECGTSVEP